MHGVDAAGLEFLGATAMLEKRLPGFFYWIGKGRIPIPLQPAVALEILTPDRAA